MRAAIVGLLLIALATPTVAQPRGAYKSRDGQYAVKFPGTPKVTEQTAKTDLGELTVTVATYANTDGSVFMVSHSDFPDASTKPANHATLLDGIRDGVKGRDGKLIGSSKAIEFGPDKLPGRDFTVDKGKQRVRFRVILRDNRVYQIAAIGTAKFADGKDATEFIESFELTK